MAMFPNYEIAKDADVPLHDECWPWHESGQSVIGSKEGTETNRHIHKRGKQVLNRIFGTEIDDGKQPCTYTQAHVIQT